MPYRQPIAKLEAIGGVVATSAVLGWQSALPQPLTRFALLNLIEIGGSVRRVRTNAQA